MRKIYNLMPGLTDGIRLFYRFPGTAITNGAISARLLLPHPLRGYYRGVRFDWSANMPSLKYKGHEYFGKWFGQYHPEIHDVIMGPVEEFASPDYSEVKPGEDFLKIGVGILSKPDDKPYDFRRLYPHLNKGKWEVKKHRNRVEFVHELTDKIWSYLYSKTVQLTENSPELVISHTLKNTGGKMIETGVYDHNFFMIDNQPVGPGYSLSFPFNLKPDMKGENIGIGDLAVIKDNKIVFLREIMKGEEVFFSSLEGFGKEAEDYRIIIENLLTGSGVRITCDQPFLKLAFWSCPTTLCPEPYIKIKAGPGQEFSWNIRYKFYTRD